MREDILKGCGKFLFEDDFEDSDDLFEHNVNCGDQMIRNGSTQYCSECQAKLSGYDQAIRDIFKKIKWALKLASPKDNALNYKKYQEDVIELIKEEPQNSNQSQQTKPIINSIVNAKSDDGSVTDKTADTSQEVILNQAIKEVLEKMNKDHLKDLIWEEELCKREEELIDYCRKLEKEKADIFKEMNKDHLKDLIECSKVSPVKDWIWINAKIKRMTKELNSLTAGGEE
jgi:hypothetical protein